MQDTSQTPTVHRLRIKEADFKDLVEHPRLVYLMQKPTEMKAVDGDYLIVQSGANKVIRQITFVGELTLSLVKCKIKLAE